jgi:2-aminobenzoate-CoA ligase
MPSAQVDRFCHDRLPDYQALPQLIFNGAEYQLPEQLNVVAELLDKRVQSGGGARALLRDAEQTLSYAQVQARVNQTARVLQEDWQLVAGNRVLLRGGNSIDMAIAWLAVAKLGLVVVASMPMLRARELTDIVTKGEIVHALCAVALKDELLAAQPLCPTLKHVMLFDELAQRAQDKSAQLATSDTAATDIAMMAFTSGTTGKPKAALHTHRDLMAACNAWPLHVLKATADDIVIGSPPLAFTFGLGGMLLFPMWAGASVYFHQGTYTPDSIIGVINQVGATICYTAPTFYRQMAAPAKQHGVPSLRICVSAGEGLPDATRQLWKQATGIEMLDGIGATEMFHIFISSAGSEVRAGAVGKVVPGYEARVVDDNGAELPRGTVGKLAVRGPTGCKYLDDPRQNNYVRAGWNYPGDAFLQDVDGYFFYQARADDMIVTAGYNVAGPEVEGALMLHPAVAECGVVGKPDDERGMIVCAHIVLKPGQPRDAAMVKALQDHVKQTLAPFKYPREVHFLDALPRTETGKLQRFRLRQTP